jgi:hypothetical protein
VRIWIDTDESCQSDVAASGSRYAVEASPSLAHLLRETAKELAHPTDFGRTLWDARKDRGQLFGENLDNDTLKMFAEEDMKQITAGNGFGVGTLGSGSDYTVFLQHIGVSHLFISSWRISSSVNLDCKLASRIYIDSLGSRIPLSFGI